MDPYIYRLIRFILLLICAILSIGCYILIFFILLKHREIDHKKLHNHVILVLLFCNFILITTELPITLVYSYQGHVEPQSDWFCSFWVAQSYGLYVSGLFLMAFGSIERYLLIFHDRFVRRWRLLIHYPPMIICFIYPLIFFHLLVNLYPCKNAYDYESYVCGGACYQFQTIIGAIDYIVNAVAPTAFITLANMFLLVRVINQKRAMKLANSWRKNRLMCIQLVSISLLYFLIWIPFVIISLIRLFYNPFFLQDVTMLIINYCLYICPLASPFISLVGLPKVRQYITRILSQPNILNHNRIRPTRTITVRARQQHILRDRQYHEHTC